MGTANALEGSVFIGEIILIDLFINFIGYGILCMVLIFALNNIGVYLAISLLAIKLIYIIYKFNYSDEKTIFGTKRWTFSRILPEVISIVILIIASYTKLTKSASVAPSPTEQLTNAVQAGGRLLRRLLK